MTKFTDMILQYKKADKKEIHAKDPRIEKFVQLDLKIYFLNGCKYCSLLKNLLKDYHSFIEFRDAGDPQWAIILQDIQATGFPTTVSNTKGTVVTGYINDIDKLLARF